MYFETRDPRSNARHAPNRSGEQSKESRVLCKVARSEAKAHHYGQGRDNSDRTSAIKSQA